jgi:flagellar hook-length control protein FliK
MESKEMGEILLDENGSVLRPTKEEHQNSETFTLFSGQKGTLESNLVMPEETQKVHEALLPKTEPSPLYQQIGKNVIWSLKNNEEKIKLTLDPPELGNIYMEINREKGNIRATLWTDNPATKEILEAHHVQLSTLLKEDGFKLEKFDVFMQQDMSSFQDRGERVLQHGPWERDENRKDTISTPLETSEISPTPTIMNQSFGGSKHVDLFV